jgi:hypothetical protein
MSLEAYLKFHVKILFILNVKSNLATATRSSLVQIVTRGSTWRLGNRLAAEYDSELFVPVVESGANDEWVRMKFTQPKFKLQNVGWSKEDRFSKTLDQVVCKMLKPPRFRFSLPFSMARNELIPIVVTSINDLLLTWFSIADALRLA